MIEAGRNERTEIYALARLAHGSDLQRDAVSFRSGGRAWWRNAPACSTPRRSAQTYKVEVGDTPAVWTESDNIPVENENLDRRSRHVCSTQVLEERRKSADLESLRRRRRPA